MRIYDIPGDGSPKAAFEVSNLFLTRRGAIRVVKRIPGVQVLESQWIRKDVFCRFLLAGKEFVVEEPWGDSSRYWIGPVDPVESTAQLEVIRNTFSAAGILGFSRPGG